VSEDCVQWWALAYRCWVSGFYELQLG
jgi:hypothetical protein